MRRALALAVLFAGLAAVHGCASPRWVAPAPRMSKRAMQELVTLIRLNRMSPTLYGNGVVVTPFDVYPEPPWCMGMDVEPPGYAILFTTSTGSEWLVLSSDGDAADLYYRITGKQHPTLKGELSEDYKAFLEGKGR